MLTPSLCFRNIILFFLLLIFTEVNSQDQVKSFYELSELEPNEIPDSSLLGLISFATKKWQETVRSNIDSSLFYANKAADYALELKNDSLLFHAYRRGANSLIQLGKFEDAREYCKKMKPLFKDQDFYESYRYYNTLGQIEYYEGNYEIALQRHLSSLKSAESGNLLENIPAAYGEIARVFDDMGQPLKAIEYAKKDVAFTMEHGGLRGKFIANYNLANKYVDLDSFPQALSVYTLADSLVQNLKIPVFNAALDLSKGRLLVKMNEAEKALPVLDKAIKGMKQAGNVRGTLTAKLNKGAALNQLGRYRIATNLLNEVFFGLGSSGYDDLLQTCRQELAKAYYHSGDGLRAYEMMDQYTSIQDSIKAESTSKTINALEIQYQTAEKERKINAQQLEIEKGKYQRNLMLGGLAMLLWFGGFLIAYLWYRNKNQKKLTIQTAALQEQKILQLEQEKNLLAMTSMIEGQEAERKRIAQDLHDGLGGILSNIKSQLHALEQKVDQLAGYDLYGKASGMIDSASQEVRRIATNMMPLALAKLGLEAAIADLVSKVEQSHPIRVNLQISNLRDRLEETREIMIYRIVQELVTNVIKHADASTLLIQLDDVNGDMLLTVEDNGKGFDFKGALQSQGVGMKSVQSRVKYLKGDLDVSSDSGGTCVVIHIPKGDNQG